MGSSTINFSSSQPNNNLFDVTCGYANENPHSFLKAIYTLGIDVPREAGLISEKNQELAALSRKHLVLGKLLGAPGKWLKNLNTLRHRTVELLDKGIWNTGYQWIRDANSMIGPSKEMVEFALLTNIAPVSKATFSLIKGVNGASTTFGFGAKVIDAFTALLKNKVNETTGDKYEIEREEAIKILLESANNVSIFALGILTVLSVFFGVAIASTTFLIFSVSSVVAHISKYFYEHIGPQNKKTTFVLPSQT